MFRIVYRKSPRAMFRTVGEDTASQWYTLQDAVCHADILQQVCLQVYVEDVDTGKTAYDATNGKYLTA